MKALPKSTRISPIAFPGDPLARFAIGLTRRGPVGHATKTGPAAELDRSDILERRYEPFDSRLDRAWRDLRLPSGRNRKPAVVGRGIHHRPQAFARASSTMFSFLKCRPVSNWSWMKSRLQRWYLTVGPSSR